MLTVGIDAEVHEEIPTGVLEQVARDQEKAWLTEAPAGIHWDRALFCAKETVYKAWFPLTGRWLDFKDVAVTFNLDEETFHAQLLVEPPRVNSRDLSGFTGRFLARDELVLAAIALPR
jgi:4'-phosphopantetheinyl transferase EntD